VHYLLLKICCERNTKLFHLKKINCWMCLRACKVMQRSSVVMQLVTADQMQLLCAKYNQSTQQHKNNSNSKIIVINSHGTMQCSGEIQLQQLTASQLHNIACKKTVICSILHAQASCKAYIACEKISPMRDRRSTLHNWRFCQVRSHVTQKVAQI